MLYSIMSFLRIRFYPEGGAGPVRDYLTDLAQARPAAYAKLALDLETLGAEGLRSRRISLRPLGGGLWELKRRFEGTQYRVFLCVVRGAVWLLHGIEKKSAKTPKNALRLAQERMRRIS
ncbi:MAG: type II toxin-antitoxin system RelE/ParE family toxin [Elusimicrobia bacterium]|nr:type II toxin-antitoxin system RelE/ParE family toxin [Elusimicrobiota bacterium]